MSNASFTADEFRHENKVSTMNCDHEKPELEVSDGMLSVTELATRIPNKSVVAKFLEFEERIKPRMPQWDGYYPQPDHPRPYPYPPFYTLGDWVNALTSIQLFKETDWEWHVVASAGGLVLCRGESLQEERKGDEAVQVIRTAHRVAGRRQKSTRRQKSKAPEGCPCCGTWAPLVVCNPVTRQERNLPKAMACAARNGEPWDYDGVQAALIERSDLSYEVILALKSCVFVYSSKIHKWRRYQCQRPTTFGLPQVEYRPWDRIAPWTCVGDRLYCMDAVRDGPGKHVVSLFEVDYEAETWKRRGHFTVRKRHWNVSRLDPAFQSINCVDITDTRLSLEMLECMGELYVVIAAGVDEHLTTDYISAFTVEEYEQCPDIPGLETYPIQFHILNLKDAFHDDDDREKHSDDGQDSFRHRILRMVLPQSPKPPRITPNDVEGFDRKQEVLSVYENSVTERGRWFFCVARGSKIFVHLHDYLLEFDMVTGESKTGIICEEKLFGIRDTVYFPNVCIMP